MYIHILGLLWVYGDHLSDVLAVDLFFWHKVSQIASKLPVETGIQGKERIYNNNSKVSSAITWRGDVCFQEKYVLLIH